MTLFQYKFQTRHAYRGVQSIYVSLYDAINSIRKTQSFGRDSASFSGCSGLKHRNREGRFCKKKNCLVSFFVIIGAIPLYYIA